MNACTTETPAAYGIGDEFKVPLVPVTGFFEKRAIWVGFGVEGRWIGELTVYLGRYQLQLSLDRPKARRARARALMAAMGI